MQFFLAWVSFKSIFLWQFGPASPRNVLVGGGTCYIYRCAYSNF